jgi:hypothetical protein
MKSIAAKAGGGIVDLGGSIIVSSFVATGAIGSWSRQGDAGCGGGVR